MAQHRVWETKQIKFINVINGKKETGEESCVIMGIKLMSFCQRKM